MAAATCVSLLFPLHHLRAQVPQQALDQASQLLGRPVSAAEALRLLQQSGLSPDQVRNLLQQRGYDRSVADPFLAVLEGEAKRVPEGANAQPLYEALTGVDLASRAAMPNDSLSLGALAALQSMSPQSPLLTQSQEEPGPPVFGRAVFRQATSQFEPLLVGPVPSDYRVGPGDELVLVLTGDVELAYRLDVSREGWIVIPDVGQVTVAGSTMAELKERLTRRLSQVYSGLTGGADATTWLDLSLGRLRTNLVYVIGEVERPGAYQISSFGRVLAALYAAGGPKRTGSFRQVLINRAGHGSVVDLYDYLVEGRLEEAPRLENGDIVFVPVAHHQVEMDGAVVRPAIYEMREGEGLQDALRFAGGLAANAYAARAQIARILPPEEQQPGLNRVLVDVPLTGAAADRPVPLTDGDRVTIFAVLDDLRNSVRVSGGVWRPGVYGVEPGLRLWDVIERAGGLLPDVYAGRAQIQRLQDDWTRRMIQVSLARNPDGSPVENPDVEPQDQVYVFARRDLRDQRAVSIGGWVRDPGVYPFVEGMTVRDLILRAGGLRMGAYLGAVDVARVVVAQDRSDTLTQAFTVALDSSLVFDVSRPASAGGREVNPAAGREVPLRNLDAVYVRKAPGFEPQQRVVVTGQVMFPGPYSLQTRSERLTDLVARAGGLTGEGYAEGLQLWRPEPQVSQDTLSAVEIASRAVGDTSSSAVNAGAAAAAGLAAGDSAGAIQRERARLRAGTEDSLVGASPSLTRVGIDYVAAVQDPSSSQNLLIEPGDSIFVPRYIPTVDVRGAVQEPTKVLWKKGEGADYYIRRAGGYLEGADKDRTRVQLANGEVLARGSRFLFFGGGLPDPDPGSVITVPVKPPKRGSGLSFAQIATVLTGILTASATIVIAAKK